MPRLVLVLTTRRVASTAPEPQRQPPEPPDRAAPHRGRAQEEVDEVQAGQIGKAMDVSGLSGSHLEQARKLRQPTGLKRSPAGIRG